MPLETVSYYAAKCDGCGARNPHAAATPDDAFDVAVNDRWYGSADRFPVEAAAVVRFWCARCADEREALLAEQARTAKAKGGRRA